MPIPLRVLILEDRAADAELILHALRQAGFDPDWQRVETEADYLARLDPPPEVILADYTLPQFDAMRALRLLQERGLDIPFIVATGSISEEVAVECIKQGAADYLLKDRLARLGEAVRHALQEKRLRDEKQRAEEVLRESEERFRALIENSSDGIMLLDADGVLLYASPATSRILGYALDALVGQNALELVHPDDIQNTAHVLADLRQKPNEIATGEFRCRHKDGSWRWIEAVGNNLLAEPSVGAIIVNYRDITERKQAEEALRQSEERFRALIENATDLIIVLNPDGTGRYISPSVERILGFRPDELIGTSIADFIHPDDLPDVLEAIAIRLQTPGLADRSSDFRIRHKDGSYRMMEVIGNNLLDNPAVNGIVVNARDITERKQAEGQIQRQVETLGALYDLSRTLSEMEDFNAILDVLTRCAVETTHAPLPAFCSWRTVISSRGRSFPCACSTTICKWGSASRLPPIPCASAFWTKIPRWFFNSTARKRATVHPFSSALRKPCALSHSAPVNARWGF